MVHCCCIPGCSDSERHLSFFGLPLKNKAILKLWIHRIGQKVASQSQYMRNCSEYFEGATKRWLLSDEYHSLRLSILATSVMRIQRNLPKEHTFAELLWADNSVNVMDDPVYKDALMQANNSLVEEESTGAQEHITTLRESSFLHWISVLWCSASILPVSRTSWTRPCILLRYISVNHFQNCLYLDELLVPESKRDTIVATNSTSTSQYTTAI